MTESQPSGLPEDPVLGWAALNGTWALMAGLNKACEVKEERRFSEVLIVAFGLTISLGVMGVMALVAMLYGNKAANLIGQYLGLHTGTTLIWKIVQWLVIVTLLLFSFAVVYRFGPNLKDRRWQEHARRSRGGHFVDCVYTAVAPLSGALQLLPEDLRWIKRCGCIARLAIFDRRCHPHRRRGKL